MQSALAATRRSKANRPLSDRLLDRCREALGDEQFTVLLREVQAELSAA